jgi:hypothetical protein
LKIGDNNLQSAVEYMKKGLDSDEPGTQDARFYFHLGDAMQRLGMVKEVRVCVHKLLLLSDVLSFIFNRSQYFVVIVTYCIFSQYKKSISHVRMCNCCVCSHQCVISTKFTESLRRKETETSASDVKIKHQRIIIYFYCTLRF